MNKVIVISGGSSGLGRASASLLTKENVVIILGREESRLKLVAKELGCDYIVCDITDIKSVENAVRSIVEERGHIDVLINNAGTYIKGETEENSIDEIKSTFDTNVIGLIQLTRAVVPHMKKLGKGTIINIASTAALHGSPKSTTYHSSKYAVSGYSESLHYDLKKYGINVSCIYPGGFSDAGDDSNLPVDEVAKAVEFIVNAGPNTAFPKLVIQHRNF